jgi:hypothetical protein
MDNKQAAVEGLYQIYLDEDGCGPTARAVYTALAALLTPEQLEMLSDFEVEEVGYLLGFETCDSCSKTYREDLCPCLTRCDSCYGVCEAREGECKYCKAAAALPRPLATREGDPRFAGEGITADAYYAPLNPDDEDRVFFFTRPHDDEVSVDCTIGELPRKWVTYLNSRGVA